MIHDKLMDFLEVQERHEAELPAVLKAFSSQIRRRLDQHRGPMNLLDGFS